jgi:hypothetical protein
MCHRGPGLQPDPAPQRDREGCLTSGLSASFAKGSPARGELSVPGTPTPSGASHDRPSLLGSSPLGPFGGPVGDPRVKHPGSYGSSTPGLLWRLRSVWAIRDPGTATVVVRLFLRITRDYRGGRDRFSFFGSLMAYVPSPIAVTRTCPVRLKRSPSPAAPSGGRGSTMLLSRNKVCHEKSDDPGDERESH